MIDPVRCPLCKGAGCRSCGGRGVVERTPYYPDRPRIPEEPTPLWFRLLIGALLGAAFAVAGGIIGALVTGSI